MLETCLSMTEMKRSDNLTKPKHRCLTRRKRTQEWLSKLKRIELLNNKLIKNTKRNLQSIERSDRKLS